MLRLGGIAHLTQSMRRSIIALLVILISMCALSGVITHSSAKGAVQDTNCSALCSSHSSQLPANLFSDDDEEKEDEPIPPVATYAVAQLGIIIAYALPISVLVSEFYRQKNRLLSTALRP